MSHKDPLYTLHLDLNLVNTLRGFKHNNHTFEPGFVETVYAHLFYYSGT